MNTFVKLSDFFDKGLHLDDNVNFYYNGETYIYVVRDSYLYHLSGDNSKIFRLLGMDEEEKRSFCRLHYGYKPGLGMWPDYNEYDWDAATRVVIALFEILKKEKFQILPTELFEI